MEAAIALADEAGFEALSIRKVAERLGVAPMSVYTYVPSKAELLLLMVDAVHGRMVRSRPASDSWRARVTAVADDNRSLYEQHPSLIALPPNRPPLGPGTIAKYDHELGAFEGTGLGDVERDAALTFVLGFVEACAHAAARARAAEHDSRLSDAQWWEAHAPELARVFDPARYPLATRVGAAAGEYHQAAFAPEFGYRFGLARVLDGLEALIEQTRARSRRT